MRLARLFILSLTAIAVSGRPVDDGHTGMRTKTKTTDKPSLGPDVAAGIGASAAAAFLGYAAVAPNSWPGKTMGAVSKGVNQHVFEPLKKQVETATQDLFPFQRGICMRRLRKSYRERYVQAPPGEMMHRWESECLAQGGNVDRCIHKLKTAYMKRQRNDKNRRVPDPDEALLAHWRAFCRVQKLEYVLRKSPVWSETSPDGPIQFHRVENPSRGDSAGIDDATDAIKTGFAQGLAKVPEIVAGVRPPAGPGRWGSTVPRWKPVRALR